MNHKQGCPALPGYGVPIESCSCGADKASPSPRLRAIQERFEQGITELTDTGYLLDAVAEHEAELARLTQEMERVQFDRDTRLQPEKILPTFAEHRKVVARLEAERDEVRQALKQFSAISGALMDAGSIPVNEEDYAAGIRLLIAERDEARRERDLAIAHDRQPYPTAEAYEAVCHARNVRAERAETALVAAETARETLRGKLETLMVYEANGRRWVCADSLAACLAAATPDAEEA